MEDTELIEVSDFHRMVAREYTAVHVRNEYTPERVRSIVTEATIVAVPFFVFLFILCLGIFLPSPLGATTFPTALVLIGAVGTVVFFRFFVMIGLGDLLKRLSVVQRRVEIIMATCPEDRNALVLWWSVRQVQKLEKLEQRLLEVTFE